MSEQRAQHTPGPWVVTHAPTSAGSVYRIGQPGLEKGCAWIYADGIRKGIDDEIPRAVELAANARLIAAAPELLEAAEDALGVLNGAEHALPNHVVRALERAIAKATGSAA